jgi:transposase
MFVSQACKIYLFTMPTDMRKGFDGLSSIVHQHQLDLFSGDFFVFISKKGDRIKILTWDRGGLAIWYKRLEKGTFKRIQSAGYSKVLLDSGALVLLLEGLDPSQVKRPNRWLPN